MPSCLVLLTTQLFLLCRPTFHPQPPPVVGGQTTYLPTSLPFPCCPHLCDICLLPPWCLPHLSHACSSFYYFFLHAHATCLLSSRAPNLPNTYSPSHKQAAWYYLIVACSV